MDIAALLVSTAQLEKGRVTYGARVCVPLAATASCSTRERYLIRDLAFAETRAKALEGMLLRE